MYILSKARTPLRNAVYKLNANRWEESVDLLTPNRTLNPTHRLTKPKPLTTA